MGCAAAGESTLEIPGHVPQSVQYDEGVQGALHELGGILRESAITPEVGQSYVDVYAEYAMESPATTLFVARDDDGHIVGSLTLAVFRVPTGVRAWIEDVVVDTSVRGAGIGSALVNHAIEAQGDQGDRWRR